MFSLTIRNWRIRLFQTSTSLPHFWYGGQISGWSRYISVVFLKFGCRFRYSKYRWFRFIFGPYFLLNNFLPNQLWIWYGTLPFLRDSWSFPKLGYRIWVFDVEGFPCLVQVHWLHKYLGDFFLQYLHLPVKSCRADSTITLHLLYYYCSTYLLDVHIFSCREQVDLNLRYFSVTIYNFITLL